MLVRIVDRGCQPLGKWHGLVKVHRWYQPGEPWEAETECGMCLMGLMQTISHDALTEGEACECATREVAK